MAIPFVGRSAEIEVLDSLWAAPAATLIVVYGRRRVGKTRLLTEWLNTIPGRALYWVAEPTTSRDQLRSFSQAVFNFANPGGPAPASFSYASWAQAWQEVARLAATEPLALVVDEFTYLLEAEPGIGGILQNQWDHALRGTRLHLALCGSHMGMMEREVLAHPAPLYGRATAQLHLQPLPFGSTLAYFPRYSAEERVAIYAIFGGIPAYWERLDPSATIAENIRRQLLTPNQLMQDEPRLLLADFVREPRNYVAILRAIAGGSRTQSELAPQTGLDQGHVSKYLAVLRAAGFVERRIPVTEEESSRRGRYHVVDPYLRFYYRFLSTRQNQLALGIADQALAEIQQHLRDFIGTHTWEELCREWLLRASAKGAYPGSVDQVGSLWTKDAQIDVAGFNSRAKVMVLGECKWGTNPAGREVLRDLVAKTDRVVPKTGQWSIHYLGFARTGWTPEAKTYAQTLAAQKLTGANWRAVQMDVVGLGTVDEDLYRWTGL